MSLNHANAAAYARQYALTANPAYPPFPNDCTSFVSQAMLAGGWTMVGGTAFDYRSDQVWWWGKGAPIEVPVIGIKLKDAPRGSHTWGGAANFARFLQHSGRANKTTSSDELNPGDIIQIGRSPTDIFHTMIVTNRDSKNRSLLLSYHTTNRLDWPLSKVQESFPLASYHYLYWKVL